MNKANVKGHVRAAINGSMQATFRLVGTEYPFDVVGQAACATVAAPCQATRSCVVGCLGDISEAFDRMVLNDYLI